jgi:DNA-binding beta-propeller fold protein YncE
MNDITTPSRGARPLTASLVLIKKHGATTMPRLLQIVFTFLLLVPSFTNATEKYETTSVVLGTYSKVTGGKGTFNVPWTYIYPSHVAIDDHRNIYVLDRQTKRVLHFSESGRLIKEMTLSNVDFSDKSDELGDDGYIEYQIDVSSDGKFLYVTEGSKENNWAVINIDGKVIRKNISLNWINRRCGDKFRTNNGAIELDNQLNIIKRLNLGEKKNQRRQVDSEDNVYTFDLGNKNSNKVIFTKVDSSGNKIYRKEFESVSKAVGFVGFDAAGNAYISIDRKIFIMSTDGSSQSEVSIPDEPFFKGSTKWKVLCDGTLASIPDYSALWQGNKGKLITGEYSIYFFKGGRN